MPSKTTPEILKPEPFDFLIRSSNPNRLTKMMIDDFRQDPVLAVRWILGMELPPHQRLRLRGMWRKKFFLDDSGISTGKDATAAMCAAVRCILFPDWISTFLAKGIKQLANINEEYFIKWNSISPYFANEVEKIYTPKGVMTVKFKNDSMIKLMAAGWDRDAETLRSERWNEVFMNEWHTYGNMDAIQRTAFGRVTRYHPGKDVDGLKEICGAHITLMASAGYKWMPEYKIVSDWQTKINQGNHLYGRQRWDYYDIPKNMRSMFTDEDIMKEMFESLPIEDALVEIIGVWQHSSSDFYDSLDIEDCRTNGLNIELKRTSEDLVYVAGVDIARNRDDFTIVILKFGEHVNPEVVYCFRGNGMKTWQMSGMIHYVNKVFNLNSILMDAGGGGLYVKEELEKDIQIIGGREKKCSPILTQRDYPVPHGRPILELFKWAKEYQSVYRYFSVEFEGVHGDDGILDASHTMLKSAIQLKTISFPITSMVNIDPKAMERLIESGFESSEAASEHRIISENIDNMLEELIGVKRKLNKDKSFYKTQKGFYSWISVKKKDSAYALLYSYICYKIFMAEHFDDEDEEDWDGVMSDDMFLEEHQDPFFDDALDFGDYQ